MCERVWVRGYLKGHMGGDIEDVQMDFLGKSEYVLSGYLRENKMHQSPSYLKRHKRTTQTRNCSPFEWPHYHCCSSL